MVKIYLPKFKFTKIISFNFFVDIYFMICIAYLNVLRIKIKALCVAEEYFKSVVANHNIIYSILCIQLNYNVDDAKDLIR